ncbi:hypothetical protein B005_4378 [Nocardiopsis alba ATCC BAA-2165]|uniref:Uncharacterized protein n=1 Tax=Nocardiopsis alba (strain ATCC BAA-2165 / BE74) TaxID=1205910 RepID=J7KWZ8_NOCAA|nr:hypothetical protein B005_4378 [Nocardiopsis alba ATCC BAA-2165]
MAMGWTPPRVTSVGDVHYSGGTSLLVDGVIPACAGSRVVGANPAFDERGHPRVRGEQRQIKKLGEAFVGSSPRARGAGRPRRRADHLRGVIPACAGSRSTRRRSPLFPGGHPRVRGEQGPDGAFTGKSVGSSPRARGAARGKFQHPLFGGGHPRVRGEQPKLFP